MELDIDIQKRSPEALWLLIYEKVTNIEKTLNDNGQPGLKSRVSTLEAVVNSLQGNVKTIFWLIGILVTIGCAVAALKK